MQRRSGKTSSTNGVGEWEANGSQNGHQAAQNGHQSSKNGFHAENGHAASTRDKPMVETSRLAGFLHHTLVPLLLMSFCPNLVILLWYTAAKCDGSIMKLFGVLSEQGVYNGVSKIWSDVHIGSSLAVWVLLGYMLWAALLMKLLPGERAEGPVTPKGNVPVYKDNGFKCFVVTMLAFVALTYVLKQFGLSPAIVYDRFDEFLGTLTIFSHVLCIFLHLKGLVYPSTSDCGSSGNLIFDYYWGTELYPRVFGIDIKVFTNCRFGMTIWALLVAIFAVKSYETYGFVDSIWVSTVLQMIYFAKFFWWEAGYMRTIDIMLDRAGFYICWGCLAYIPGLYASVSMYLVHHPVRLGPFWSILFLVCGTMAIVVNYIADKQKQDVRRTKGECLIWGKKPDIIRATFEVEDGKTHESILLVSGWWKVARHFHYIPELLLSFFWSVPGLFENLMVYFYFLWLVILLTHRTYRDDIKCGKKYKQYWTEYCTRVPYKMIPGIF